MLRWLLVAVLMVGCVNAEEIIVGVIGPMDLPEGKAELKAAQLAAEEINKEGGILGHKVKVIYGNTKLDPNVATSELRRLVDEGAKVLVGGFSSGVMLAMMETMAEEKVVFLADCSSPRASAKVAENYEKYKYWFRISQNNGTTFAYDLADMVKFLNEKGYSVKRVYIIRDEHIWTDDVMKTLKPLLDEMGVEIVKDVKIPRGYSEFEQLIIEAEDMKAEVIMPILAITGTDDILVKQWATLKPKVLLAGHSLAAIDSGFYNRTEGSANYMIFIADGGALITAPPTERCRKFIEAYKSRYGHYPESHQAYGAYDALYIYKLAVEKANEAGEPDPFDPDTVVKYLETFNESNPVELTRVIAFTSNHDLAWGDDFVRNWISQWQDGKQFIIHPKKVANGELKLPDWFKKEEVKTPGFEVAIALISLIYLALRRR